MGFIIGVFKELIKKIALLLWKVHLWGLFVGIVIGGILFSYFYEMYEKNNNEAALLMADICGFTFLVVFPLIVFIGGWINTIMTARRKEKWRWWKVLIKKSNLDKKVFDKMLTVNAKTMKKDVDNAMFYGKIGNKYITRSYSDESGNCIVAGGTRAGKSTTFAIPSIAFCCDKEKTKQLVVDPKGELTAEYEKYNPDAKIIRIEPKNKDTYTYDPFWKLDKSVNKVSDALNLANSIIPSNENDKNAYFNEGARHILAGIFLYYHYVKDMNFIECCKKAQVTNVVEFISEVMNSNDSSADKAKMCIADYAVIKSEESGSMKSTISNRLLIFADDIYLANCLSGDSDKRIEPEDIESCDYISIIVNAEDQDKYSSMVGLVISGFFEYFKSRDKKYQDKVISCVLEEFPQYGASLGKTLIPTLSIVASNKIIITLIMQSIDQLTIAMGDRTKANAVIDNCQWKYILQANGDTAEYFSKCVGKEDIAMTSKNVNRDLFGLQKGTGNSTSQQERNVIKPQDFSTLVQKNKAVLFTPKNGIMMVDKVPYYVDRNTGYQDPLFKRKMAEKEKINM